VSGVLRIFSVLLLACLLFGCGGGRPPTLGAFSLQGSPASAGPKAGAVDDSQLSSSGMSRPSGMLIDVPNGLRAAFSDVYSMLRYEHQTTLHVVNHYGLEHRRALAYYLLGTYRHIMLDKLVLIMAPGDERASCGLAAAIAAEHGCSLQLSCYHGGRDIHYLEFSEDQPRARLAAVADAILSACQGQVDYCGAENYLVFDDSPGDPNVRYELGQCYSPLQVSAPLAWQRTRGATAGGEPILIALFDSGFYRDLNDDTYLPQGEHADLEGVCYNLGDDGYRVNYSGHGAEDIYAPWEDLVDPSPVSYPYQTLGHGTRVAGVIAAQLNNRGVAGIAPDAKIVPFRLYVPSLAYIPVGNLTAAAEVCVDARADGHPIRVVNISAHVEAGEETADLELAVRAMSDAGIVTVSSATGNEGNAKGPEPFWLFPAAFKAYADGGPIPNIIAVAWLGIDNRFKDFYSSETLSEDDWDWSLTDVFAPSEHMMLTNADGGYVNNPPEQASGVSFGIPVVAGIAALYWAAHPDWTAAQVRQELLSAARPIYNFGLDHNGVARYREAYAGYVAYPSDSTGFASTGFVCNRTLGLISRSNGWQQLPDTQVRLADRDFTEYHDEAIISTASIEALDELSYEAAALVSLPIYTGGLVSEYLYYTRSRVSAGWAAWGDPGSIYSAAENQAVGDYCEGGGAGYILFQPATQPQDNYLVNYGLGSASTGLHAGEYPLELAAGNGGMDTLLLSFDQAANQHQLRWQVWGMPHWPAPAAAFPANYICTVNNISHYASCAWLNPQARECNIGHVDILGGAPWEIEWDAPVPVQLDEVVDGWPHGRQIIDLQLTGSSQGLHYLVITSRNIDSGHESFVIEGVRLLKHAGMDDTPIIESLLTMPWSSPGETIDVSARIDPLNRLHLCYALYEEQAFSGNGYFAKTLDYGNLP